MTLALIKTQKGGKAAMKFYIAKMCDLNTQDMNYMQSETGYVLSLTCVNRFNIVFN